MNRRGEVFIMCIYGLFVVCVHFQFQISQLIMYDVDVCIALCHRTHTIWHITSAVWYLYFIILLICAVFKISVEVSAPQICEFEESHL